MERKHDLMERCGRRRWLKGLLLMLLLGMMMPSLVACGPSFPGTITLEKIVAPDPVLGMTVFDDRWMYVIDEAGKLRVYDIKDPAEPKRGIQVDAFKDDSYQMGFERNSQWLVVVGKSGKMMLFDLRLPESPDPIWGAGKTLKLKGVGPFFIRTDSPVMYLTPSSGAAIHRIDLASLGNNATDQGALDTATKTIPGGGGGGIVMPYDQDKAGLRIYVGNRSTGKLDIWNIEEVEKGTASKPVKSLDIAAGTGIKSVHLYQEKPFANQGWLLTVSDSGDIEYHDLGRNYTKTDEPASLGTASVPGVFYISNGLKLVVSDQLKVYDFTDELAKPVQFAQPEVAATIILRDMVVYKDYIFTAEASGLVRYKYAKTK